MIKLKVGITGGIGSGKTTVCKIFETLDIPVYYADDRAKALMTENKTLVKGIKTLFGKQAYWSDGSLNRKFISDIAFQNPSILAQLNALVHPVVFEDGIKWHANQRNVPYTLKEAALLYETGSYQDLDKVITVYAPSVLRIERVLRRSAMLSIQGLAMTKEDIEARIAKQMPDEEKVKRADFVIYNDSHQALIPQVMTVHHELCRLSRL